MLQFYQCSNDKIHACLLHLKESQNHEDILNKVCLLKRLKGSLPVGVRCLQVITGSGRPLAMQTKVTLLPSFTVTSDEMLEIFGGTVKTKADYMCNHVSRSRFAALIHATGSSKLELSAFMTYYLNFCIKKPGCFGTSLETWQIKSMGPTIWVRISPLRPMLPTVAKCKYTEQYNEYISAFYDQNGPYLDIREHACSYILRIHFLS